MRAGKRTWFWCVIALCGGAIAVLCYRLWPRERLLLQRASRVASVDEIDYFHSTSRWVSDHELAQVVSLDEYPATVMDYDLANGQKHSFPIRQFKLDDDSEKVRLPNHAWVVPSPDGQWALCWDAGGVGGDVLAVELRTGRTLTWPSLGHTYHLRNLWMADGKHWLQYPTIDDGYLTVYSTEEPKKATRLTFPDPAQADWRSTQHCLTRQDHLLFYNEDNQPEPSWTHVDVREYRLLPSVSLLHIWHLHARVDQEYEDLDFSPTGDKVAWLCSESYVSPLSSWLHRWWPQFAVTAKPRLSIWASNLDGSDAHEVGHLPESVHDPQEGPEITDLHWLPSGKRLCFVYKGSLYTVPVE